LTVLVRPSILAAVSLPANGEPLSAARVSLAAVRPAEAAFGGLSILPWARSDAHASTSLTIHNVGPSPLAFRIVFLNPDGSLAGHTSPHVLSVGATQNLDLGQIVGSSGIQWSRGAVHVQWASREFTRLSAAATFHREPDEPAKSRRRAGPGRLRPSTVEPGRGAGHL
jgi:hypothetical protein